MNASDGRAVSAALPDLVYVIGPGTSGHEELRYSLRSVAKNLPHRKVWIVGSVPAFITNIEGLSLTPHPDKFENQRQSLAAVVEQSDLSENFVLMNDDMFILSPVDTTNLPVWHLGPIDKYLAQLAAVGKDDPWVGAIRATAQWVGWNPNAYECHIPLLFSSERLRGVLSAYPIGRPFGAGMVYELAGAGSKGLLGPCVKVSRDSPEPDPDLPFLSSVDWSFDLGPAGRIVRKLFPQKCEYEA